MNVKHTKQLTGLLFISILLITNIGAASQDQRESKHPQTPRTARPVTTEKSGSWTLTDPVNMFTKNMRKLKLDLEKRKIIQDILEIHQEALDEARMHFTKAFQTINKMTLEAENEEDIRGAADDLGSALGDLMVLSSKIYIELQGELTPEQQNTLKNMNKQSQHPQKPKSNKPMP